MKKIERLSLGVAVACLAFLCCSRTYAALLPQKQSDEADKSVNEEHDIATTNLLRILDASVQWLQHTSRF